MRSKVVQTFTLSRAHNHQRKAKPRSVKQKETADGCHARNGVRHLKASSDCFGFWYRTTQGAATLGPSPFVLKTPNFTTKYLKHPLNTQKIALVPENVYQQELEDKVPTSAACAAHGPRPRLPGSLPPRPGYQTCTFGAFRTRTGFGDILPHPYSIDGIGTIIQGISYNSTNLLQISGPCITLR